MMKSSASTPSTFSLIFQLRLYTIISLHMLIFFWHIERSADYYCCTNLVEGSTDIHC